MPAYGSIDPALEGIIVTGEDFVESGIAAAAAGIGFGRPVFMAEDDAQSVYDFVAGQAATLHLKGVTIRTAKEYAGSGKYFQGESVNFLRIGQVWVTAGVAVKAQQPAFLDASTGGWTNVSAGNVATPYYFRDSGAAGALVKLDITKSPAALAG